MPMHRWMQSAAGGTSQRLKPAVAIVRSLSRIPPPPPDIIPASLIVVVIDFYLQPPFRACCRFDPVVPVLHAPSSHLQFRTIFECARIAKRIREFQHQMRAVMPTAEAGRKPTL